MHSFVDTGQIHASVAEWVLMIDTMRGESEFLRIELARLLFLVAQEA